METGEFTSALDTLTFDEASLISVINREGLEGPNVFRMLQEWSLALDRDLDANGRTHLRYVQTEVHRAKLYAAAGLDEMASGTLDDAWQYVTGVKDMDPAERDGLKALINSVQKN